MKRRINLMLSEKEEQFIEWSAKKEGVSFQEEMQILFYHYLRKDRDQYDAKFVKEVTA